MILTFIIVISTGTEMPNFRQLLMAKLTDASSDFMNHSTAGPVAHGQSSSRHGTYCLL